jgi:hypothetical protein
VLPMHPFDAERVKRAAGASKAPSELGKFGDSRASQFTVAIEQVDNHAAADPTLEGQLARNGQSSLWI